MDTQQLVADLAHLQKESAALQIRLLSWTVTTADDRDAVREDVRKLSWTFSRLVRQTGINVSEVL